MDRFYEKEKLLEACYSHDAHHKNSDTYPYVYTQRHEQRTLLYASMMFVLMLGLMTVLYMYVYARYVAVMYMGVFVLLSYMDGFDRLVLGIS
ncbi:hypothetical protein EON65_31295 [archaeon]|nr:MAG: hypothetical protein EON65_31295 [archaeon]